MNDACDTPMHEHVSRFWRLLSEGRVRVLVETHHEWGGSHWNGSSFPDDVAKAIAADRRELLEALKGVVAVSDRKTDEYDRAHAAIATAEGRYKPLPGWHQEEAARYASSLAVAIWERHFKHQSPDWKPHTDTIGILTQIDNMSAGQSAEIDRLRAALQQIANECGYGLGDGGDRANDIATAALEPAGNPPDQDEFCAACRRHETVHPYDLCQIFIKRAEQ